MDSEMLKRRREQLGLNQSELARLLGVPRNTVWRWEAGTSRIQHATMLDLALWAIEKQKIWSDLTEAMAQTRKDRDNG